MFHYLYKERNLKLIKFVKLFKKIKLLKKLLKLLEKILKQYGIINLNKYDYLWITEDKDGINQNLI